MTNKQQLDKDCWVKDKSGQCGTVKRCFESSDWIKSGKLEIFEARTL